MVHLNRAGNPHVGSAWFKTFLEVHTETPTRLMAATLNAPLKHERDRIPRVGVFCVLARDKIEATREHHRCLETGEK